jgi:hypothetical protein
VSADRTDGVKLDQHDSDAYLTKKDMEELVHWSKAIVRAIGAGGAFLVDLIKAGEKEITTCELLIGMGSPQQRLGNIHHSFAEALVKLKGNSAEILPLNSGVGSDNGELRKLDQSALENYLKCGIPEGFDEFFDAFIQPLAQLRDPSGQALYFVDIVLTTAIPEELEDVEQVLPEIRDLEALLTNARTIEQIRARREGFSPLL